MAVEFAELISPLATLSGSGAILFFLRRGFSQQDSRLNRMQNEVDGVGKNVGTLHTRMDQFCQEQHACQLANAREFATKHELRDVDRKCDRNSEAIAGVRAKVEG